MTETSKRPTGDYGSPQANLVSVIIPCYNHARFLDQAIESALAQTYSNFEIIVVDDGSTDDTAEVAKRYSDVRYIHQENAGRSSARNAGLRQSRGQFLVFLDADDRLLPHALETGVSRMREHPECAFVSGHCRMIDANGTILPSPRQRRIERDHYLELLRGGSYIWCPASVLYQQHVFNFVHGFDLLRMPVEDYDLYLRITRDFPVYSYHEIIAEYRQHRSNTSRDVQTMQRAALAAHEVQWNFIKANIHYTEAYEAGERFWKYDYPFQRMVARIREIAREQLPLNAVVAVATGGSSELLRLDGRRAWHFPQIKHDSKGELFAQGAEGSMTTSAWIEPGMGYEFSLYGGPDFSHLLARLLVTGTADPLAPADAKQVPSAGGEAVLTATPNPVPAAEGPGTTRITWSTGNGSEGQVYVSSGGAYWGRDPINSDEAWASLEFARVNGAQYLLIPTKSFWWLDPYQELRDRVEARYPAIVRDQNTCVIFDLRESPSCARP